MVGRVVSTKMTKTAVVLVESKKTHPMYNKTYAWTKKYIVDDPLKVEVGDVVTFVKIRPISKMKHWQITKVLGKDIVSLEQAELAEDAAEAIAEVLPVEEVESAEKIKDVIEKPEEVKAEESNSVETSRDKKSNSVETPLDKKPKKVKVAKVKKEVKDNGSA